MRTRSIGLWTRRPQRAAFEGMRARGRCGGALHIQSRMRAILAYAAALLAAAHAAAAATHVARAAQLDVPVREP